MACKNGALYGVIAALLAATWLAIYASELRRNLHTTQAALAKVQAQSQVNHHEAAICRGMVGGQAVPTWQVRISTRL